MHYYKFNIPDWILHTSHLTPEEEGIYFRLLNHFYDTESPIPEETQPVIRRLRLSGNEDKASAILEEFFQLEDGFWRHKRCEKEILAYQAKASTNKQNGSKGGRPKGSGDSQTQRKKPKKTQSVNSGNPDETLTKNQEPLTTNDKQTTTPPKSPKGDHERFDEFYLAYPRKAARAQAVKAWNKLKADDILINTILDDIKKRIASGNFDINDKTHIPHPATYLNGRRWDDEIIPIGVPHETYQQPSGARRLSAVDRLRQTADEREGDLNQQIRDAEAEEALGPNMDQPGGDLWPSADQSVREYDAGDLGPPTDGVLVN